MRKLLLMLSVGVLLNSCGNEEPDNPERIEPFDQGQANTRLLINAFSYENVSSITGDIVALCENSTDKGNLFKWDYSFRNTIYTVSPFGNVYPEYRLTTSDDWSIVLPKYVFEQIRQGSRNITEYLYGNQSYNSEFVQGFKTEIIQIDENTTYPFETPLPVYYAIRFKGTDQMAAFRYEFTDEYLEVKVKAIPDDGSVTLDDIKLENIPFWKENYIEKIFPYGTYWTSDILFIDKIAGTRGAKLVTIGYETFENGRDNAYIQDNGIIKEEYLIRMVNAYYAYW